MKKLKCYDCDEMFEAETADDMLNKMHPHYMSDHQDVMKDGTDESKAAWMKKFHEDWDAAEEVHNDE